MRLARIAPTLCLTTALALAASCASAPTGTDAADTAPLAVTADWTLVDQDGEVQPTGRWLADGERVVLVFWQTWCGSCVEEAPRVERLHREHPELHVIGVISGSVQDVDGDHVRATALRLGLTYPQVLDRDLALTRSLGVNGTPTVVVLGAGGEVLYDAHELPADWSNLGG